MRSFSSVLQRRSVIPAWVFIVATSSMLWGCKKKEVYKPEEAYKGPKASLPKPPTIPAASSYKSGSHWTIYGLQHHLSHPRFRKEVSDQQLSITGFVVDIYRPAEPAGKEGCVYPGKHKPTSKEPYPKGLNCDDIVAKNEPPHFYIADNKDEKNPSRMVKVMGYASSYIQQAMARDHYKEKKVDMTKDDELYNDNNYSAKITFLGEPRVGTKVVVSGKFGVRFQEGQGGQAVSPWGIVDVASTKKGKIECLDNKETCEEPPQPKKA